MSWIIGPPWGLYIGQRVECLILYPKRQFFYEDDDCGCWLLGYQEAWIEA